MKKKMISKRIVASVAAIALTLTAVNVQPFKDMFDKNNTAYADGGYGNSSGGSSVGNGSAGSAKAGNFCISGGSSGVRIYLAPDDIIFGKDEGNVKSYEATSLTEERTGYLTNYRYNAIYELSAAYDSPDGSTAVNDNTRDLHMMSYNSTTKLYDMYTVPDRQVISTGAGLNQNPDFAQLVGTTDGFNYIGDTLQNAGTVLNFDSLASWANGVFGADKVSNETFMNTFLSNYKNIIGEDAFTEAQYPTDFAKFEDGGWVIVVEPVMMSYIEGKGDSTFAFSLQDYIWNAAGGSLGNAGKDGTMSKVYGDIVEWGFSNERILPFQNFYANFTLDGLMDASGNPKSKTITGSGDTSGFSIYGTFSGSTRRKTGSLTAAQNFLIAPSEQYKFRSTPDSETDSGAISINSEVSSSALLGMSAAELIYDENGNPLRDPKTGDLMYENDYAFFANGDGTYRVATDEDGNYIRKEDADTNYDGIKSFVYEDMSFESAYWGNTRQYDADVLTLVVPWYGHRHTTGKNSIYFDYEGKYDNPAKSVLIPEDGEFLKSLKLFAFENTEGSWNFTGKMGTGTTDTVKPNAIANTDYVADLREELEYLDSYNGAGYFELPDFCNEPNCTPAECNNGVNKQRYLEISSWLGYSMAQHQWSDPTLTEYAANLSGASKELLEKYMITSEDAATGFHDSGYYFVSYSISTFETYSAKGKSLEKLKMEIADGDITFTVEPSTVLNADGVTEEPDTKIFYLGDLLRTHAYYKGAQMDNGVSGIIPDTQGINGSYSTISWKDTKGLDDTVPSNATLDDTVANLSLFSLANSALSYTNRTSGNTVSGEAVVGVAIEQVMPRSYTDSYFTYGARMQNGEVWTGGYIDTTGIFMHLADSYLTSHYIYVDDDFSTTELDPSTNEEVKYDKTANTKSREHLVATQSMNQIPAVIISIPNSYANALGYNMSEVGAEKFYDDLFAILERDNARLNDAYCMSTIQDALTEMLGIDVEADGNIMVKLASDGADGKGKTKLLMGAWGNADGELAGYSTYIVQDAVVSQAIECEAELKAYQVNYIYPTILGKTEAALLRAYTNTGTEISFTKTADYDGALINANAADKITLLYNNADTNNIFAAEQIDPKTFNASDLVPTSDAFGSYGYATLTHMLNLSRKVFNDNMVASSISYRGAGFTADYLNNLGINVSNKGTDLEGEDGQTASLGSVYDIFRWSASRGLDLSSNGQNIFVTPFSDGQDMTNAGYNLTSYASMYRSNPRGTGDSATSGVIPEALIKATENSLTYKSLSVEAYDTVLNFYPEFKMIAYAYNPTPTDGTVSGQPTGEFLYMMAEKVRTVKASGLYYMGMTTAANPMQGTTISDTVATGTNANALSQKFGGLQVVYAGGNINLDAKANTGVDLDGFVLDLIDLDEDTATLIGANGNVVYTDVIADGSNIKDDWGNEAYEALTEYKNWVTEVRNSLGVSMKLTTYQLNGNKVKEYTGYNTQVGKVTGGEVTGVATYVLTFKDGVLVQDNAYNELIKAIAKKYYGTDSPTSVQLSNAKAYFAKSNMSTSILEAIESSTDSDNGSEVVGIYGDKKWYDEEVRSFVIREYHTTPLKIDNILVSDKVDITAGPSQTGDTAADLFKNGYRASWSATIYLTQANSAYPDMTVYKPTMNNMTAAIESGSVLAYGLKIEGADFVISDATTSDMR